MKKIEISDLTLRQYLGGTGIGARLLYDAVQPGVNWDDPQNCVVVATGPLNGLRLAGAGAFSIVTKGPLTHGAASSQACGFFGAYLKWAGFDGVAIEGIADSWVYLYFNEGKLEIRDAEFLRGMDTLETEHCLKEELHLPGHQSSVFAIGPAAENGVRFAALVGDGGHVAAHNGIGAVLGKKKVKALLVSRGSRQYSLFDAARTKQLAKDMINKAKKHPKYGESYKFGTSHLLGKYTNNGLLPVKNLTTSIVEDKYLKLKGEYYRQRFELRPTPCWACPTRHCHKVKVTEGPYKGLVAEEPEYELFAGFGSMIGQDDPGAVVMLNDLCDRLGMDGNEASWLTAFAMECYEKGILSQHDLDGIDLTWGNVEAVKSLLIKISKREGIGSIFAEGVMRASQAIGGEAENLAVYVKKGHAPRGHDHRARWTEMFDSVVSNVGTIESTGIAVKNQFDPLEAARAVASSKLRNFVDSLVVCMFPTMTTTHVNADHLVELLNSATGWDYTMEEANEMALRVVNLLRAFNSRHGLTPQLEYPSVRYGSSPVDGPIKDISVMAVWDTMLNEYYLRMGWDLRTGKPLLVTMQRLGLEQEAKDLGCI